MKAKRYYQTKKIDVFCDKHFQMKTGQETFESDENMLISIFYYQSPPVHESQKYCTIAV